MTVIDSDYVAVVKNEDFQNNPYNLIIPLHDKFLQDLLRQTRKYNESFGTEGKIGEVAWDGPFPSGLRMINRNLPPVSGKYRIFDEEWISLIETPLGPEINDCVTDDPHVTLDDSGVVFSHDGITTHKITVDQINTLNKLARNDVDEWLGEIEVRLRETPESSGFAKLGLVGAVPDGFEVVINGKGVYLDDASGEQRTNLDSIKFDQLIEDSFEEG